MMQQKKTIVIDFNASSSTSDYSITSHPGLRRTWSLFSFVILSLSMTTVHSGDTFLCDPATPSTCGYGGACSPMHTVPQLSTTGRFEQDQHICRCEAFECTTLGFEPVCGEDKITYINDVCRRARECSIQAHIRPVCKGRCGQPDCEPIVETAKRCPPHQAIMCKNFGECLLAEVTNVPHCKCLDGYSGDRCQTAGVAQSVVEGDVTVSKENFSFKIAFLCVLGLVGLIGILHATHCVIRCRESSDERIFDEEDSGRNQATSVQNPLETQHSQEGGAFNHVITIDEQDG